MTDASPGKLTRQQLYDRIRESSKDEYILSEMKRLGFWPADNKKPSPAEQSIKRQGELQAELRELYKRKKLIDDPEAALKQMRKERMLESRKTQEENRIRRNQERYDKAVAWQEHQKSHISYVGEGVSAGLRNAESDAEKLAANDLPVLHHAADLATAMGVTVRELRFLAYSRKVSKISHYRHFDISKKTGGTRRISAPMPRLKRAQYWLLENVFNKPELHEAAHGFVTGRSIVSNAQPHVGAALVMNMDLKDFFPTITFARVKGLVKSFGYSEQIAILVGLVVTEPNCDTVELHGERFYVAEGQRRLPQGSPASPSISNIICRRLDRRLRDMAAKLGFTYTRYADDMSFSAKDRASANNVMKLSWRARSIIADEGFAVHPDKTRIMRKGARQEVTGIVVNDKTSIERSKVRKLRAAIHRLETSGVESVDWYGAENVIESITGYANYLAMVDPEKGRGYLERLAKFKAENNVYGVPREFGKRNFRLLAAKGEAPGGDWWAPSEPQPPVLEKTQAQLKEAKRAQRLADRPAPTPENSSSTRRSRSSEAPVDPATGRFRPSVSRSLWMLALFVVMALVLKNPGVLFVGACWVAVSHLGWKLHVALRILLTIFILFAISFALLLTLDTT